MNVLSPKAALWMPFVLSLILVNVPVLASLIGPQRFDPTSGIIYTLPMVFFTVATTTGRYVSQLEKRVAELEQRLSAKAH